MSGPPIPLQPPITSTSNDTETAPPQTTTSVQSPSTNAAVDTSDPVTDVAPVVSASSAFKVDTTPPKDPITEEKDDSKDDKVPKPLEPAVVAEPLAPQPAVHNVQKVDNSEINQITENPVDPQPGNSINPFTPVNVEEPVKKVEAVQKVEPMDQDQPNEITSEPIVVETESTQITAAVPENASNPVNPENPENNVVAVIAKNEPEESEETLSMQILALHHLPLDQVTDTHMISYLQDVPTDVIVDCLVDKCLEDKATFDALDELASKDPSRCRIFVRHLKYEITKETLATACAVFGTVVNTTICMDKSMDPPKSKGFGFVTFESAEGAAAAVTKGNVDIEGRMAHISMATPSKRDRDYRQDRHQDRDYRRDRSRSRERISPRGYRGGYRGFRGRGFRGRMY